MLSDAELAQRIRAASDLPEMAVVCGTVADALGFEHFLYGFRVPYPLTEPYQLILSGYPAEWMQRYDEQRYLQVDPVLQRGLAGVTPFTWDELDRSDARVAQLFDEAAAHGLRHGLSVAVHGARGEGGLMSLARDRAVPRAGTARQRLFQRVQWFTALMHQRLHDIVLTADDPPQVRPLTPRERECLMLAAEGRSAHDIGRDMQIAERTVVFHLTQAEQKLGTRRRQAAVARAVALGAIGPKVYPDRLDASRKLVQVPKKS